MWMLPLWLLPLQLTFYVLVKKKTSPITLITKDTTMARKLMQPQKILMNQNIVTKLYMDDNL